MAMFQLPSFKLPSLAGFFSKTHPIINIPSVKLHDIESTSEKRTRTLKHLIKANHANFAILYNHLHFHNHTPHILGSGWILGATDDQLHKIYDEESKSLEPWTPSPSEVSREDWRNYLGSRAHQRAFLDFFEDELARLDYSWEAVLETYLFANVGPLLSCVTTGLGHPLIHLGYAYELQSRDVAMEAISMTACFYTDRHQYIDDPAYTIPDPNATPSLLEILKLIRHDRRFDEILIPQDAAADPTEAILPSHEALILEYWNKWALTSPTTQFQTSQETAVALLDATPLASKGAFDFFLQHTLTTSHATRILLPLIPPAHQVPLVRQWWLFAITTYVSRGRPAIDLDTIRHYHLAGRDWKWAVGVAVNGRHATDPHFVKAIRAMKEAAATWGDANEYFLKAAVKLAAEFEQWHTTV